MVGQGFSADGEQAAKRQGEVLIAHYPSQVHGLISFQGVLPPKESTTSQHYNRLPTNFRPISLRGGT